ncbi:hypothetical protein J4421_00275 [Candidatus Woesearchaeota archaeon]|nr:hypothetical protein [Candidatus Woesearchaeota archaeon]
MEVKDVQANKGNVDVVLEIVSKDTPRSFSKFGKEGKVCTVRGKDETGEITITLWNEDIEKVDIGDKVHLSNGWCSEYKGEKQLSAGKFGKIEVIGKAPKSLFSNDPELAAGQRPKLVEDDEEPEGKYEPVDDEYVE